MVLREITTSSSSDSLFTDPLTPLGFAAEFNQCYYSDENVYELDSTSDSCKDAAIRQADVFAKLTVSKIDCFDSTMNGGGGLDVHHSPMLPATHIRRCSTPSEGVTSLFSVSRFKKTELSTIQTIREPRPGLKYTSSQSRQIINL